MKGRAGLSWRDFLFLLTAVVFLFGCVATSHRSGKTLDQGQFSIGMSYDGVHNIEEADIDMVQLFAVDGRVGVFEGFDVGAAHTWDITADNDGMFNTWWGGVKWQTMNHENIVGKPYLSLGLLKGYIYHEDAETHVISFPMTVSVPTSETVTGFFTYRFENFTEDFIPDEWDDPRHGFFLGSEFELGDGTGFTPVVGADVGILTSLYGGEGDTEFVINAGVSFNSPSK